MRKIKYLWFDGHKFATQSAGTINIHKFDAMPDALKLETLLVLRYLNSASHVQWNKEIATNIKNVLQRIKEFQQQQNNEMEDTLLIA